MSHIILYTATADVDAKVWSLETCELLASIAAHRGSVLCLFLSTDGKALLSSGGDAIVNVGAPSLLHLVELTSGRSGVPPLSKDCFQSTRNLTSAMCFASRTP